MILIWFFKCSFFFLLPLVRFGFVKNVFSFTGRIKHIWAGHRRVQERREPVEPWTRCRCKEEEVALGCIRDTSQTVQHVSAGPQQQLSVPQAGAQLQDALPRYAAFFLTIHMLWNLELNEWCLCFQSKVATDPGSRPSDTSSSPDNSLDAATQQKYDVLLSQCVNKC